MIVVRVELHSAVTGKMTEIARMKICNDGQGTAGKGNYNATAFRGRSADSLDKQFPQRTARILDYPREAIHVWNLVARILTAMKYA